MMSRVDFPWVCPQCHSTLEVLGNGAFRCPTEGLSFSRREGVLSLLSDERFEYYRRFLEEYRTVRGAEQRGIDESAAYRALPFVDLGGKHCSEWRIRAASFRALMSRVVAPMARSAGRALTIADLGAGNTWMSRRLALEGHRVVAVDLHTGPEDGLGAGSLSDVDFDAVQAEFDRLPIPEGVCDLVVFNGAFHYSTDPGATLAEALRVIRAGGALAILDTPVYRSPACGEEMVEDRRRDFLRRFGVSSDSIPCRGFLSFSDLDELAGTFDLQWQSHRPFFGFRWALRPLLSSIRGRREPATFILLWASKPGPS